MSARPTPVFTANPGLPGFSRFWVLGFVRSREMGQWALDQSERRIDREYFPTGKFSFGVPLTRCSEVSCQAPQIDQSPKTFLQESFSRPPLWTNLPSATRATTGGLVMPPTK